MAFMLLFY
ncbi:uncharacterized protein FFM5_08729 [Fusarium fujikuroi]|nr:uncharacterized protein FFM5_08729 [Fusarium fujikuroi]